MIHCKLRRGVPGLAWPEAIWGYHSPWQDKVKSGDPQQVSCLTLDNISLASIHTHHTLVIVCQPRHITITQWNYQTALTQYRSLHRDSRVQIPRSNLFG